MPRLFRYLLYLLIGLAAAAAYDKLRSVPVPAENASLVAPDPLFSGLELPAEGRPAVDRFLERDGVRRTAFRTRLNAILTPAQRRQVEDHRWAGLRADFRELNPTREQEAQIEALLREERPRWDALAKSLLAELRPLMDPQELLTLEERLKNRYGRRS